MFYLLLTLLVLDAVLLITIVLLQAGKGGGLAAMGAAGAGSDSLFGSRQAATLLTKATWWTGGIFLVLSFLLSVIGSGDAAPESILRTGLPATTTPALPTTPVQTAPAGTGEQSAAPEAPAAVPAEQQ